MFIYDKKLQYPVKIDKPNPRLAAIIISQYGGPDGELGASLRYLSQRYSMPFDEPKGTKMPEEQNSSGIFLFLYLTFGIKRCADDGFMIVILSKENG